MNVYRIPRGGQNVVNNTQNNQNFTGTLGANYRPNARWNFMANASSAWRAATVNELYSDGVHHGAASFERGDENLVPESALNLSFTANYVSKNFQAEFHLYNNYINNFIFLSPTGRPALTIRGAFPEFIYTQTDSRFQGFDFTGIVQIIKNLSLNSKISYLKAQDLSNNQPLIQIPANRWENTLRYEWKKNFGFAHKLICSQAKPCSYKNHFLRYSEFRNCVYRIRRRLRSSPSGLLALECFDRPAICNKCQTIVQYFNYCQ